MARIFSIHFEHQQRLCTALVTVRSTPFFTEYTLSLDDDLLALLPGNKLISTGPHQFVFPGTGSDRPHPLTQQIITAVAQHLQATEV